MSDNQKKLTAEQVVSELQRLQKVEEEKAAKANSHTVRMQHIDSGFAYKTAAELVQKNLV